MASTPPPSAPSSRPSSPSPSRTGFRTLTRMGTMLRRNSSTLNPFTKPALGRSESKSSLRKEALAQASAPEVHTIPSPVAESPNREAAEEADNKLSGSPPSHPIHHPSPLAHQTTEASEPVSGEPAAPSDGSQPLVESPKAIATLEPAPAGPTPSAVPTSTPAVTATPQPPAPAPATTPTPDPAPSTAPPASVPETPAAVKQVVIVSPREEDMVSPEAVLDELELKAPSSNAPSVPAPPAAVQERSADYFAWSNIPKPATKKSSTSSLDAHEPVPAPAPSAVPAPAAVSPPTVPAVERVPSQAQDAHRDPWAASAAHVTAWQDHGHAVSPKQSAASIRRPPSADRLVGSPEQVSAAMSRSPSREQLNMSPRSVGRSLSPKPSKSSIASSYYGQVINVQSGGREVRVAVEPDNASIASEPRGRSRSRTRIK